MAASLNRILELVHDRPREGRDLLFRHICDLFFNGPLPPSPTDRKNLLEILEILRPQVDITVRRELAGRLYSMEQPPEPLLRLALGDLDEVAGPVIDYAALPDRLLMELARSGSATLRKRLARRRDLSPEAQAALADNPDKGGAPDAVPGAPVNLDLRRDLEWALAEAARENGKLRDYSRSASDWLWECDRKGRLTYLSETAIAAFGRPPSTLLGLYLDSLCGDDGGPKGLRACLDGWRAFGDLPVTIPVAGEEPQTWLLRAVPVFELQSGRFEGFRGAAQALPPAAVTAEEEDRESADHLITEELLGELGHELKTPLNAILGFSEMMELGTFGPVSPEYARCLEQMRRAGQQVDDLISDILEGAKFRPRDAVPALAEVAAADLVAGAIKRVWPTAERQGLTVEAAPLPFRILLHTDPVIAEYCLVRLLRCAIAEAPAGGRLSVRMASCPDGRLDIHVPFETRATRVEGANLPGDAYSNPAALIKNHRLAETAEMARRIGAEMRRSHASLILSIPHAKG